MRAVGPSLAGFGVPQVLADPRLEFFLGSTRIAESDDWAGDADLRAIAARVGAFPLSSDSKDAALQLRTSSPSQNSIRISANGNTGGAVLAEFYDATPADEQPAVSPRLINVSVLKDAGDGLTAGFVIRGSGTKTVLVRGIGPSLSAFGITDAVVDPRLEVFNASGRRLAVNDDWGGRAAPATLFMQTGAFAPVRAGSKDAALVIQLPPGAYTVQLRSDEGASGPALIEVYEVP